MNRTGGRQARVGSGLVVSTLLHGAVFFALLRLAGLAAAPMRLDVFVVDPVEATSEPVVDRAPAPTPRPTPPRPARPAPRPAAPRVAAAAPKPVAPPAVPARPASAPATPAAPFPIAAAPAAPAAIEPTRASPASEPSERADVESTLGPLAADAPAYGNALVAPTAPVEPEVATPRPAEGPAEVAMAPMPVRATPLQPVPAMPAPANPPAPDVAATDREQAIPPPAAAAPADVAPSVAEPAPPPTAQPAVPAPSPPTPSQTPVLPPSPSPPRVARAEPSVTPGAALGLGLGRLQIRLDGARTRTTDQETDVISGTLVGGAPARLVVQVGDRTSEPKLDGRVFTTTVKLVPGLNRIRVEATDAQGVAVEEVVAVNYVPPVTLDVALTSPRDGLALTADDLPVVDVQGQVSDASVTSVWIVSNDRRVSVPVTDGRFRHVLPVFEPLMRIRAEAGTERRGSATVTVNSAAAMPAIGFSLIDWPRQTAGPAQLAVMWRPNPARLEGSARALPLRGVKFDNGEPGPDFFYLRDARPGVYTFVLTYRAGSATAARAELYVAGAARPLRPVTLDGAGRAVIARILLPQGVLWDDDDWFTGRSANGDTVTKFRFPDGVTWMERSGDPLR